MAAARASLEQVMTPDAYEHLNYLNDRLIKECDAVFAKYDFPGYTVGIRPRAASTSPRQDHRLRVVHQVPGLRALQPGLALQHQPRCHHGARARRGMDAVGAAHRRGHRSLRQRVRRPHPGSPRLRRRFRDRALTFGALGRAGRGPRFCSAYPYAGIGFYCFQVSLATGGGAWTSARSLVSTTSTGCGSSRCCCCSRSTPCGCSTTRPST